MALASQARVQFADFTGEQSIGQDMIRHKDDAPTMQVTCSVCLLAKQAKDFSKYQLRRRQPGKRACAACYKKEVKLLAKAAAKRCKNTAVAYRTIFDAVDESNLHRVIVDLRASPALAKRRHPRTGRSLLHSAVLTGDIHMVQVVLGAKPDVAFAGLFGGETPLHHAVLSNDLDMVDLLLISGMHPNIANKYNMRPMHYAQSVPMAEFLLRHGASDLVKDRLGRTPLDTAVENGHHAVARFLGREQAQREQLDVLRREAGRRRRADAIRAQALEKQREATKARALRGLSRIKTAKEDYLAWRNPGQHRAAREKFMARLASRGQLG